MIFKEAKLLNEETVGPDLDNIFVDAYYGKPYKTRDGRRALYHSYRDILPDNPYATHHNLILEKLDTDSCCCSLWIFANDYGHTEEHIEGEWLVENKSDIISEWEEEPINEAELDKLAEEAYPCWDCGAEGMNCVICMCPKLREAFKAGYRKRKGNAYESE